MIESSFFLDKVAILPSKSYVFDFTRSTAEISFKIIERKRLSNNVEVIATNIGILAFDFDRSEWGGLTRLQFRANGTVPDEVMENSKMLVSMQIKRMRFMVFVAACVFGTFASRNHRALEGMIFPELVDSYAWTASTNDEILMPKFEITKLEAGIADRISKLQRKSLHNYSISRTDLREGLLLADRLLADVIDFTVADPIALITMTYQAMILHGLQHAGASVALSAVVIEAALEELLFAAGLVANVPARLPIEARGTPAKQGLLSRNQVKKLGFEGTCGALEDANVISKYLRDQIDTLRKVRNDLMHRGQDAMPRESGSALTAVRDVLSLCTNEPNFELNTSWSFKI